MRARRLADALRAPAGASAGPGRGSRKKVNHGLTNFRNPPDYENGSGSTAFGIRISGGP
jgi:hypothetical protein